MATENDPVQPRAVVWIVADLRSEVASLTRLLSVDFDLTVFEDGPQMLERLKSAPPPDVLVIEQRLRGLTGVEICRVVRASPSTVGLPILLLSVPVDDDEILQGLSAGADDYLIKPFSPALLAARIVSFVRMQRLRERAERAEKLAGIAPPLGHADRSPVGAVLSTPTREPVENPVAKVLREGMTVGLAEPHKLREGEERVRRVVDASGAGLWDLDAATGQIEADARMVELMGFPPGSTFNLETGLGNLPAEDAGRIAAAVAAALAGENEGRYLVEFRTGGKSGSPHRWVESRAQVSFDAQGKATRLAGAMIDITTRKQAEAAQQSLLDEAKRSEQSFRTLAEAIPQQVWTSTPDGALDFVNERVLAYFASTREKVLGAGWQAVIHPEDLPGCIERWTH
ncbi:MAG: response regulator, partial [Byssovorax sp.]